MAGALPSWHESALRGSLGVSLPMSPQPEGNQMGRNPPLFSSLCSQEKEWGQGRVPTHTCLGSQARALQNHLGTQRWKPVVYYRTLEVCRNAQDCMLPAVPSEKVESVRVQQLCRHVCCRLWPASLPPVGAAVFLQVCVHMCVKQGDRGGDRDRPDIGTAKNGKVGLATKSQVTERGFVIHSLNT